ncbi:ABC transporter permease subunit [Pseudooceanicola sp. 216_PA32_1]|uniref:ABC transporter permease subunit n=1 Tax=Pseudooceanicola pacificus TaxID=2676438 RepID=A0A844W5L5_9RHOB|nr:ABC transporter permease [Pseudooceanicola pacificus]MWB78365.1 ABC transporter permease subunit [Pseudooceanicola pacificus]
MSVASITAPGKRGPEWLTIPVCISLFFLLMILGMAVFGPMILGNGNELNPMMRLKPPSAEAWFGTDNLGRDIFARTVSGARNSVIVGVTTAALVLLVGGALGVIAGYFHWADMVLMRVADGLMAIPGILLAIALVSLLGGGLVTVIIAIAVPEIPRTARLLRSVVLSIRELPFVMASVSVGSATHKIILQHIVPNAIGALMVQATYVCAAAVLSEAALSFLGVGTPPDVPSWGNVVASGKDYFRLAPWIIAFPGIMLSILVLSINILGDQLRDQLDPRLTKRRP